MPLTVSLSLIAQTSNFCYMRTTFPVEGLINPATSRELGKLIGVDTIIVGTTTLMAGNIRLSVRAIDVETGKIVSSRSETMAANSGLEELFRVGVSGQNPDGSTSPSSGHLKSRLRADSLSFAVDQVLAGPGNNGARFSFRIENHLGIGLFMAIQEDGYTIGPCRAQFTYEQQGVTGLNEVDFQEVKAHSGMPDVGDALTWVPPQGVAAGTIQFGPSGCNPVALTGLSTVSVTATVILADEIDVLSTTLSASNVSVRILK